MSSNAVKWLQVAAQLLAVSVVAACTNNGVDETALVNTPAAAAHYSVGGTVSGLKSSGLVLQSNTGEKLKIAQNGAFQFTTTLTSGSSYYVLVSAQPQAPNQTCSVSDGTGTITNASVTNIAVACQDKSPGTLDSIGGIVVGVTGSGLVLQNNGGDNLSVASNGSFVFPTPLASNEPYSVAVFSPPINPAQNCAVSDGSGTTDTSDVTNVVVTCTVNASSSSYTVGGTVSGLPSNTTLVLQDNGRDNLKVSGNGSFSFHTPIPTGGAYSVTVCNVSPAAQQSQTCVTPTPSQSLTCTITNASGVVGSGNVANVGINCASNGALALTVSVSGLGGSGLVLQDNGSDNLLVPHNATTATFATALPPGSTYSVTVLSNPANLSQTCAVTNGAGTAGVTSPGPSVTCTTNSYSVGGTVTGLPDTSPNAQNLILEDNLGNDLPIPATVTSGPLGYPFTFTAPVLSGSPYSVTVKQQPGSDVSYGKGLQTSTVCVVKAGTAAGTVTGANISSIVVDCVQPVGFVYVTNGPPDNSVSSYLLSYGLSTHGSLLSTGTVASTGTDPSDAAAYIYDVNGFPTPASSFLYVTNHGSNDLTIFAIDPNSGVLTNPSSPGGLTAPASVTVRNTRQAGQLSPALYVTSGAPSPSATSVYGFTLGTTGTSLTPLDGSPYTTAGLGAATSLTLNSGSNYYLATLPTAPFADGSTVQGLAVYPVNGVSGVLGAAQFFQTGAQPSAVAVQPSDFCNSFCTSGSPSLVYVANSGAGTISTYFWDQNGDITPVGLLTTGTAPVEIPGLASLTVYGNTEPGNPSGFPAFCCSLYATGSAGIYDYSIAPAFSVFIGQISGNILTITDIPNMSTVAIGQTIGGTGVASGTTILGFADAAGGTGTYSVSDTPDVPSEAMFALTLSSLSNATSVAGSPFAAQSSPGPMHFSLPPAPNSNPDLWAVNVGSNTVSGFSVSTTGASSSLAPLGIVAQTGSAPSSIIVTLRPNYFPAQ